MEDSIKWEQAIDDEMRSLETNDTWVLTELPAGKRALLNNWFFRIKTEPDGKRRFKAHLVVKAYSQKKGIDDAQIFSPVVKLTSIRILLSIVASENLHLEQMDVKNSVFTWRSGQRDLYAATGMICGFRQGTHGVQTHHELVCIKASTKAVVKEI